MGRPTLVTSKAIIAAERIGRIGGLPATFEWT
jgi:hypothetical protein